MGVARVSLSYQGIWTAGGLNGQILHHHLPLLFFTGFLVFFISTQHCTALYSTTPHLNSFEQRIARFPAKMETIARCLHVLLRVAVACLIACLIARLSASCPACLRDFALHQRSLPYKLWHFPNQTSRAHP